MNSPAAIFNAAGAFGGSTGDSARSSTGRAEIPSLFRRTRSLGAAVFAVLVPMVAVAEGYSVRGLTEPVQEVVLGVPTQGLIARLPRREGDFIEAGTVVVELSSQTEQLEKTRRELQLKNLARELERLERLANTSITISAEELDRKRSEVLVAEVELQQAVELVARRRVVSPIAGIITDLPVKVGEYCELGRTVARVVDSRQYYVTANVDPKRAGHLQKGDPLEFEVAGRTDSLVVRGRVEFVSPVIDPASGLMRIRALFLNGDEQVRPGTAGMLRVPPPPSD